jgi:hypothetical protein
MKRLALFAAALAARFADQLVLLHGGAVLAAGRGASAAGDGEDPEIGSDDRSGRVAGVVEVRFLNRDSGRSPRVVDAASSDLRRSHPGVSRRD